MASDISAAIVCRFITRRVEFRRDACGELERLVNHFQTSVTLAAEHQMVCIAQERLQVGFLLARERKLEDGVELELDCLHLAVVESFAVAAAFDEPSISPR